MLDHLRDYGIEGVVFHWYTGSAKTLDEILHDGHYLSVNPAMVRTKSGQTILQRMPLERIVTETDGPYVKVGRAPAKPWDVALVEQYLAEARGLRVTDVHQQIWRNFRDAVPHEKPGHQAIQPPSTSTSYTPSK